MQEQHAEITVVRHRLRWDRTVHIGVTAWLEEERPTQAIEVLARVAALLEDRRSRDRRQAVEDHSKRLASGVGVDGLDPSPAGWRRPAGAVVANNRHAGDDSHLA